MTSTALDLNHHPATALAIEPGQPTWDKTQLAALAQLGLEDAGDGDRPCSCTSASAPASTRSPGRST